MDKNEKKRSINLTVICVDYKKYYINIFKLSALKGIIYLFYDNIYTCEMKLILRNIFSFTGKTDNIKC